MPCPDPSGTAARLDCVHRRSSRSSCLGLIHRANPAMSTYRRTLCGADRFFELDGEVKGRAMALGLPMSERPQHSYGFTGLIMSLGFHGAYDTHGWNRRMLPLKRTAEEFLASPGESRAQPPPLPQPLGEPSEPDVDGPITIEQMAKLGDIKIRTIHNWLGAGRPEPITPHAGRRPGAYSYQLLRAWFIEMKPRKAHLGRLIMPMRWQSSPKCPGRMASF